MCWSFLPYNDDIVNIYLVNGAKAERFEPKAKGKIVY
jgi:hypothetical protein